MAISAPLPASLQVRQNINQLLTNCYANEQDCQSLLSFLRERQLLREQQLHLQDRMVVYGPRILDLSERPRVYQLFETFCKAGQRSLARSDLIRAIYLADNTNWLSERRQASLSMDVVKLISRTRRLAQQFLDDQLNPQLDWFPYDPCSKTWTLLRLRQR